MDFVAFDIALFSVVLIYIGFYLANKVQKRLWANTLRVVSVILSFTAISLTPAFLDMPMDAVNKIGMYWLYLFLASCIFLVIKKRWLRKKSSDDDS